MSRLAPLDLNKLDPEQKKVADAIMSGPRGGLRGPFEPWLRSPILADPRPETRRVLPLPQFAAPRPVRTRDLPGRAALQGRSSSSTPMPRLAKEAGLAEDIIEAVRLRATPPFKRDVEKVVYDFVTEYLETNRVAPGQLQARHRCVRREGCRRSRGCLRLLHAGLDDPQRLRDAAAAG
jgi:4-carboxymuconolactone decarboxylase